MFNIMCWNNGSIQIQIKCVDEKKLYSSLHQFSLI